jgi:hypothetical protein
LPATAVVVGVVAAMVTLTGAEVLGRLKLIPLYNAITLYVPGA